MSLMPSDPSSSQTSLESDSSDTSTSAPTSDPPAITLGGFFRWVSAAKTKPQERVSATPATGVERVFVVVFWCPTRTSDTLQNRHKYRFSGDSRELLKVRCSTN